MIFFRLLPSASIFLFFWATAVSRAQMPVAIGVISATTPAPTAYAITQQDGNSQVWERTEYEPSPSGQAVPKTHKYTELATGLNHLANGQWVASSEEISILPNGEAAATNGQHQAYFPADIYNGQIELVTPDGRQLKSQPVGLCYDDGSNTVFIAVLTNSVGQLLSANRVIYTNAFAGVEADLVYTYTKAGFEQDIVLRAQPPTPATFNLNPDNTRLQVLTEFFDPPQPASATSTLPAQAGMTLADETLSFGTMQMVPGKAFVLGENSPSVQVAKSWVALNGRQFLVEEVPVAAMAEQLESLPQVTAVANVAARNRAVSKNLSLPAQHLAKTNPRPLRLAKADISREPGVVLDYLTVNSSHTDYTFQGDTTYYISGTVYLYGTNNIFEGGAVIKTLNYYSAGLSLDSSALINCQGTTYRPTVFTSANDNTVGETISGSTGTPASGDYPEALYLGYPSSTFKSVSHLRILYASVGLSFVDHNGQASDIQCVNCGTGMAAGSGYSVTVENALFSGMSYAALGFSGGNIIAENVTFDRCSHLAYNGSGQVFATNCIFANMTNASSASLGGATNGFYNTTEFGTGAITNNFNPFQTVGAGSHYLTNGCSFFNAGTTNIDSGLLADLQTKTTYPPIVYSNAIISVATNFSPQARRDTNAAPDLGYHYDPVDYFFGGVHATTNLTFTAGTVMGWFELPGNGGPGYGISLPNYVSVTFNGTVTAPCVEARYDAVQEGGNGLWQDKGWLAGIIGAGANGSAAAASVLNAQFTHFALLANDPNDVRDYYAVLLFQPTDCEFWSGGFGGYIISVNITNCLFDRALFSQDSSEAGNMVSILETTFHGASISITPNVSIPVTLMNCALDGTTVYCTGSAANASYATYDYNAYTNTSDPFPLGGAHDVPVTGSFNWQGGWFGNYYQPSSSPLIGEGDGTVAGAGLTSFTVLTNQTPDTGTVAIGYHYPTMPPQIVNGSFELPNQSGVPPPNNFTFYTGTTVDNWLYQATVAAGIAQNGSYYASAANAPDGTQVAVLVVIGGSDTASLAQTVNNNIAGTYTLNFYVSVANGNSSPDLYVQLDGSTVASYPSVGTSSYVLIQTNLTISAGVHTLAFQVVNNGANYRQILDIDDVFFDSPPPPRGATNIIALSGNDYDVQAVINTPIVPPMGGVAGDTVQIPAGTWTWTNGNVRISGITLQGMGTNQTFILDDLPNGSGTFVGFIYGITTTNSLTRITGITFGSSVTPGTDVYEKGKITMDGRSGLGAWRIDHCNFTNVVTQNIQAHGMCLSVIDHCGFYLMTGQGYEPFFVYGETLTDPYGDLSYFNPPTYGGSNQLYVENNYFVAAVSTGSDAVSGARMVVRYNVFGTNASFSNHGTDSSGRDRGVREYEIYNNTFDNNGGSSAGDTPLFFRGGTGLVYSNTVVGPNGGLNDLFSYRAVSQISAFGGAYGSNPWDSNGVLVAHGIITNWYQDTDGQYYIQSSNIWAVNSLVGCTLTDTNARPYSGIGTFGGISNSEQPWWSICNSNNASTIVLNLIKNDSGQPILFTNGDYFELRIVYPQLDQVGMGSGDLLAGYNPTNTVTGIASYAHEVSEPLHYWANTLNGSPVSVQSGYPNVVDGRDLTNSVFSYTPLIYPHPLDQ